MSTEIQDNGKRTVDLVWSKRPKKDCWEGRGRRKKLVVRSLIPTILRDIGPEHPIDFNVSWKKENDEEAAAAAAAAPSRSGGGGRATSKSRSEMIKEENSAAMEEKRFETDEERISNKTQEGLEALIAIRRSINTTKGALKLLIEILRLSVVKKDRSSAFDLLWAIEDSNALKNFEKKMRAGGDGVGGVGPASGGAGPASGDDGSKERYKAMVIAAKKMKQGQLQKECEQRGLASKGSKEELVARLRTAYEEESKLAPGAPGSVGKEKDKKEDKKSKKKEKEMTASEPGKKEKKGSEVAKDEPDSTEHKLIEDAYDLIIQVRRWRGEEPDIIKKQMTEMSHLLPPLSPFTSKFKLDDWQKRVLQMIDEEKSVLICAPTSSGKTVLSSYVASKGRERQEEKDKTNNRRPMNQNVGGSDDEDDGIDEKEKDLMLHLDPSGSSVLFIVPSDPLVWQVAAHFAKWQGLDNNVALITDRLTYAPQLVPGKPAAVVVGTPLAVENALTRVRGKYGSEYEMEGITDQTQMVGGFEHFKWVVYDEVHSIGADTPDGIALQRLIKSLKCKFLALSATVGNAEELRSWMETVRGEQVDAESVNANPELSEVKMEIHEGRFINLQRHLWGPVKEGSKEFELQALHPLAAVKYDFLKDGGFSRSSLPMTPQDSYTLWEHMTKCYDMSAIANMNPSEFFKGRDRITLLKTKEYEEFMKQSLETLANSHPEQTKQLLSAFTIKDMSPEFSLYELVKKLKVKDSAGNDKLPAIVFHLDVNHLVSRFKELLYGLEKGQRDTYPTYIADMEGRSKNQTQELEAALRACSTEEEKEQLMAESGVIAQVDPEQPHPDFVLNARAQISSVEYEAILKDVADNDFRRDKVAAKAHPLLRALRRGIGLYIDEVTFQAYKRCVMKLATKGKLAVVFSDESLAFGVNMPFRSCVFCGDMGGRLNATLVQQMSGRAGRRGLDTQGHLVYAGSRADFVERMVISIIPALKGSDPRYLTMFLQTMLSQFTNPSSYSHQISTLGRTPLLEHVEAPAQRNNITDVSCALLVELQLIEECDVCNESEAEYFEFSIDNFDQSDRTPSGYKPRFPYNAAILWMVWDLRDRLAESVALAKFMPMLYRDFALNRDSKYGENEDVQFEFVATLLHIVDRRPPLPDGIRMNEIDFINSETVVKRQELRDRIASIQESVSRHNEQIENLSASGNYPQVEKLSMPVGDNILDGTLLHCFIVGHTNDVPVYRKHMIKQQLWDLGCILRTIHNNLWPDKHKYGRLETLTRKCFMRIQYIAGDHIKDNISFTNVSGYELEGVDSRQICADIEASINSGLQMNILGGN